MKKLGLIAGKGELPFAIADEARKQGYTVFAVGLEPLADKSLSSHVDTIRWVNVGKFGKLVDMLKRHDVKEAVMAGKVSKTLLYRSRITPDLRAMKLLLSLKDRKDDSVLLAIADELAREGVTLLDIPRFGTALLAPQGILTEEPPSEQEWKDISFGWEIAKEMGRLDIGQTVVVKHRAVMAVEAIEGTDEAIIRGGTLAGKGAVVVKVSKPNQDMRFDVPAVGSDTMRAMKSVHARVLALEANKCLVLNKDTLLDEAKKAGITIVGYTG